MPKANRIKVMTTQEAIRRFLKDVRGKGASIKKIIDWWHLTPQGNLSFMPL